MPHQILAAVNHDGKRMPMCIYPQQMHEFVPLVTTTDTEDTFQMTLHTFACRHCGAELRAWEDPLGHDGERPPDPGDSNLRNIGHYRRAPGGET